MTLPDPLEDFRARCAQGGLDLVQPFAVADFNAVSAPGDQLPTFGRASTLGLMVANTRALWSRFRAHLRDEGWREHPLDSHVMQTVQGAAATLPFATICFWSHVITPRAIPIQRIARAAGLASLGPAHLSVHPEHGPWIALRAVVVVDSDGPPSRAPAVEPCASCDAPCVPALERALAGATTPPAGRVVQEAHERWLAVRDACPVGRASRYSDDQIGYHYTKRRSFIDGGSDEG